ncbi:MAG: ykgC, partial [Capsulimonas sp.]|nr:ykgC [Capsulimonas sp.]
TPFLDSTSVMELNAVPEHLLVLGGGYIALEFAQMFRRFGSAVTIVQRSGQLLGREDQDVTDDVLKIVREDGIEVLLSAQAQSVEGNADGVRLTVKIDGEERVLSGSHLLVATGRRPNTDRLGADAAGIALDKQGNIIVNDRLETSVSGVYAMGDVKGGPAFTHISYDDFRILKANLLDGGRRSVTDRPTPYTVFIDPQLGRVGLSETEAKALGIAYKVAKLPMSSVARALETDESRGFMKALVDTDSGQILGAAILGLDGGEVMGALQIAMMGKLPYTALRDGVFAHPTLMESLNNLFLTLD